MYSYYPAYASRTSSAVHLVRYEDTGRSLCNTPIRTVIDEAVAIPVPDDDRGRYCQRCLGKTDRLVNKRLVSYGAQPLRVLAPESTPKRRKVRR